MSSPSADVSVRVAWSEDADGISEVQARGWRTEYDGLLPAPLLEAMEPE
jgi:ribosomal protein S18 acetylase RimI-like enzyme